MPLYIFYISKGVNFIKISYSNIMYFIYFAKSIYISLHIINYVREIENGK